MNVYVDDHVAAMAKELLDEFGFDLQTAVNVFLRQLIREKEIPFSVGLTYDERRRREEIELEAEYEEYFSGANLEHLKHSIAQAEAGKIVVHDLLEA
ncbi:MAG: type II toxin-antitoxin system RelB/DinJ family antitoxin [Synergistaceae bacterium]|nr:type II toxin-antitoxin system RelB/DinJ family antitoxin [Synergistaceae bacterium]MBR0035553.1 type II toxin-antitoxin system RelB/DinJ family antitoxin [Synergistaceae bacterium]